MTTLEEIHAYAAERERIRDRYVEPMDEETIELLREELFTGMAKINRICNMILMRPNGLGEGCIDTIQDIKSVMSRLKWYLEHRERPIIRKNIDAIRLLVDANIEAEGPLGDAARSLQPVLPFGSQT